MEKYRRWTDEKVGVNPFVAAKTESPSLAGKLLSLLAKLIKVPWFLFYLPIFLFLYILPFALVRKWAARMLLLLFGVYSIQDFSLERSDKQGKVNIILSNHTCFIDVIYYLYRYPGYQFLSYAYNTNHELKYYLVSPIQAFLRSLTQVQPFFEVSGREAFTDLKDCLQKANKDLRKVQVIVFYQKIRTNGKGTIRIDKALCDQIYQLGQDCLIAQLKYSSKQSELFSLTSSGASLVLAALGCVFPGNELKIRANKQSIRQNIQDIAETHSSNELRDSVTTMAAGPVLQTSASSYYEFIDFYRRTQSEEYKSD